MALIRTIASYRVTGSMTMRGHSPEHMGYPGYANAQQWLYETGQPVFGATGGGLASAAVCIAEDDAGLVSRAYST